MSITDRAFIRAYSQEHESPAKAPHAGDLERRPAGPTAPPVRSEFAAPPTGQDEALSDLYYVAQCAAESEVISSDTIYGSPNGDYGQLELENGAQARLDATGAAPAAPHLPKSASPESDRTAIGPSPESNISFPNRSSVLEISDEALDVDDESVDYYANLDDEGGFRPSIALGDIDDESELSAEAEPFRPALEVDAFQYSDQCERLIDQLSEGLADVAHNLKLTAAAGQRVLAIAGCRRNEGRTTALLCLARSLAAEGASVAVVDADFEKPELAERMGLAAPVGWDRALRGEVALAEAVIESRDESVALVALRGPVSDARFLATHRDPAQAIAQLKRRFDVVLIDLGPMLDVAAGISGVPFAQRAGLDAALLIRDARSVSRTDLSTVQRKLSDVGVETLGVVETFAPPEVLPFRHEFAGDPTFADAAQ